MGLNRYNKFPLKLKSCKFHYIYFFILGLIKQVVQHSAQTIYTRVTKDEDNAE